MEADEVLVPCEAHVRLDAVDAQIAGAAEGTHGILRLQAGGAAMAGDKDSVHAKTVSYEGDAMRNHLPKAILLDLDDTILSFDAGAAGCWREICARFAPRLDAC